MSNAASPSQPLVPTTTCDSCFVAAPVQKVLFMQHVGALVMMFHKRIGGNFCRNCVNRYFRKFGLVTLFFGWWGMISMFATPFVLLLDLANYLRAWSLAPVPNGAVGLLPEEIERLKPLTPAMVDRLQRGEPIEQVSASVATQASVTADQVVVYINRLFAKA